MAVGRYEEPAWQQLVRQVKSYQSRALLWAVLAADSLPNWARGASFVPVPTSRWHFARRGFNQAEEIAAVLADLAGGQLLAAAREAWRRRVSHVMTEAERRTERRLFRRSCQPDQLAGQPVVLVDDVLTTGTTLLKLAEWLRRQGADVQGALVLGTVPLRRR